MEPTDMLSSLLSDPQKLQSAISMASSLLGGGNAGAAAANTAAPAQEDEMAPVRQDDDAPAMPAMSFPLPQPSAAPSFSAAGFDPSAELMAKAMPVISAIAKSGQTAVSREKANLLNSIKPFVATNVGGQIDHAMRLVSMARMARSAMTQFGSATRGPKDDGTREL